MDFGEVLDKWNSMKKRETSEEWKKSLEREKRINPMEQWLNQYGTIDKDAIAERDDTRKKCSARSNILAIPCEAHIDLHGLNREEAEKKLSQFVFESERRGCKKIMIIHGKGIHSQGGDSVLGEMVRKFIEQDKRLGMSGHPTASEGGNGATWVVLKNNLIK